MGPQGYNSSKDGNKRGGGKRVLAIHRKVAAAPRPSLAVALAHLRDCGFGTGVDF